jgi:hypothetical protein
MKKFLRNNWQALVFPLLILSCIFFDQVVWRLPLGNTVQINLIGRGPLRVCLKNDVSLQLRYLSVFRKHQS